MEIGVSQDAEAGSSLSINVTLEAQGETGPIGPIWWNATVAVEAAGQANNTVEPGSMPVAAAVAAAGMVILTILFLLVYIGQRRHKEEEQ